MGSQARKEQPLAFSPDVVACRPCCPHHTVAAWPNASEKGINPLPPVRVCVGRSPWCSLSLGTAFKGSNLIVAFSNLKCPYHPWSATPLESPPTHTDLSEDEQPKQHLTKSC